MSAFDLKSALSKVAGQPVNFAFYRGEDSDLLLVTGNPPSPKQLAKAEEECGKLKRVMKGICLREGAKLIFATRLDPAPAWEKMLTAVLKEHKCGQYLPIEIRKLKPGESDEASTPGGAAPAVAAAPSTAGAPAELEPAWQTLKASLVPAIRAALAGGHPPEGLSRIVGTASAKEKEGDFAGAITLFEELRGLLGMPAPQPAAPPPPAKSESAPPKPGVKPPKPGKLQAALNKIAPAIKLAVTRNPERKREILLPVAAFQKQLKALEIEEARQTLGEIGRKLKSLLA